MSPECQVRVRFFEPPPTLQRYFTTFYLVEIETPDGARAVDYLHPEWANLRIFSGDAPDAIDCNGNHLRSLRFCVTGPSSRAVRFEVGTTRMWGVGLLPLGWTRFVGTPAADRADTVGDGATDPAFAGFAPLASSLFGAERDPEREYARIAAHFSAFDPAPVRDEARIIATHAALIDPDVATVAELVARAGASQRTVERICERAFGFSPKLLLRRQRFIRSLVQYMLDPSLKWIGALDGHYHDQAHFVRDFKQFMGMSPRQYGTLAKPVISAIVHERARFFGRAVQALDTPDGGAAR